jgi:nucleotide-binding universal stress UspA family protein
MFKRILVAVGGDDASMAPAIVAGRLAAEFGARLTMVSVKQSTSETLGEPYYTDRQSERLGETQSVLVSAERLVRQNGLNDVETEWIEGRPAQRVVQIAEERGFDLLVVGTRRRGRVKSALLGSVSSEIAAHSHVPVLVVPDTTLGPVTADDEGS